MKNKITRIIDSVLSIQEKVSVVMMIVLLFLTFSNVVGRYLFSKSIFFADEVARFLFVWLVFLGIGTIVRQKRQVAVTLFSDKMTGVPKLVLESITALCGLVFLVILFIGGVQLSGTMNFYSSAALGIPMGFIYLAIPIGAGLTLVFHILNFVEFLFEHFGKGTDGEAEAKA